MAFIGNTNTTQGFTPAIDYFSGNASTTAFTLSRPVASVAQVQAVVNNVPQKPSDAFTVSGNTITFTSAPSSGTNNIYVYYTSPITQVIAPSQGTVGTTQLQGGLTVNFADGTAAAPSITNDGDTNTGIFFPAADTIGFAEGGAEVMRIDSSGNVLVGTANTPSNKDTVTPKLVVNGAGVAGSMQVVRNTTPGGGGGIIELTATRGTDANSYTILQSGDGIGSVIFGGADGNEFVQAASIVAQVDGTPGDNDMPGRLLFNTTADGASSITERMRIDSSGNVGIGTASPATKLDVNGNIALPNATALQFKDSGGTRKDTLQLNASSNVILQSPSASIFQINGSTEAMRIDSEGDLLINTTSTNNNEKVRIKNGNDARAIAFQSASAAECGYIYINAGGTGVTYSTSSDYRLKEDIAPMTGALAKVQALKPVTYKWKVNGLSGQGFIAHELQEVVPDCVSGEKDAVDAEGKPVYQGIDTSFLVATLTAAIQELKVLTDTQASTITALTARIEALENK